MPAVISDIAGKTGTAIFEAIIAGERTPKNFMPSMDPNNKSQPGHASQLHGRKLA